MFAPCGHRLLSGIELGWRAYSGSVAAILLPAVVVFLDAAGVADDVAVDADDGVRFAASRSSLPSSGVTGRC